MLGKVLHALGEAHKLLYLFSILDERRCIVIILVALVVIALAV